VRSDGLQLLIVKLEQILAARLKCDLDSALTPIALWKQESFLVPCQVPCSSLRRMLSNVVRRLTLLFAASLLALLGCNKSKGVTHGIDTHKSDQERWR
jgi:hypothetical protein